MYQMPNLRGLIEGHLRSQRNIRTCFSSWTAEFDLALEFAAGGGWVAILDTTLLTGSVSVYHTPDLLEARLSDISYEQEYLAYGPITGAGYHCVKVSDFDPDFNEMKKHYKDPDKENADPLNDPRGPWITRYQVRKAVRIAKRFRRPDDARPDVVLFVTAMMLALLCPSNGIQDKDRLMELICYHLQEELKAYCRPASNLRSLGLISPRSSAVGRPLLDHVLDILTYLDAHIRSQGLSIQ